MKVFLYVIPTNASKIFLTPRFLFCFFYDIISHDSKSFVIIYLVREKWILFLDHLEWLHGRVVDYTKSTKILLQRYGTI